MTKLGATTSLGSHGASGRREALLGMRPRRGRVAAARAMRVPAALWERCDLTASRRLLRLRGLAIAGRLGRRHLVVVPELATPRPSSRLRRPTAPPCRGRSTAPASRSWRVSTKSLLEVLAQSSNLSSFMPRRTGIEPLLRLNTSWNSGRHDGRGQVVLRLHVGRVLQLEHRERVDVEGVGAWRCPAPATQTKSLPGALPAAMNSPLAQSPMICMPASPLMTIAVARFQSRPGAFLSV